MTQAEAAAFAAELIAAIAHAVAAGDLETPGEIMLAARIDNPQVAAAMWNAMIDTAGHEWIAAHMSRTEPQPA